MPFSTTSSPSSASASECVREPGALFHVKHSAGYSEKPEPGRKEHPAFGGQAGAKARRVTGQPTWFTANRAGRAFHVKHTRDAGPRAGTALSVTGDTRPVGLASRTPRHGGTGPPLNRGGAFKARGWQMRAIAGPLSSKTASEA